MGRKRVRGREEEVTGVGYFRQGDLLLGEGWVLSGRYITYQHDLPNLCCSGNSRLIG